MSAVEAVLNMVRGHHACLLYSSDQERLAALQRFLEAGLEADERVVYHAYADRWEGLGGGGLSNAGDQLQVRDAEQMYMPDGAFDPDGILGRLAADIEAARGEGWAGYRMAGDMEWSSSPAVSLPALLDYERGVDAILHRSGATALCQYDRRRFDACAVDDIACVHPLVISDQRPEGASAPRLLVEPGPQQELVLRGQVDRSSSASLTRSLEAAIARRSRLRVDMRELSFIDVAGLRVIGQAGALLAARGGQLTLASPCRLVRRVLALLGIDRDLTIEDAA
jgi:anti-anti-sigma factor